MRKRHVMLGVYGRRVIAYCVCVAAVAHLLVMLLSWIVASVCPEMHIRSLLSGDGIRWMFGKFMEGMASEVLVGLMLVCIAVGAFVRSGLMSAVRSRGLRYKERYALRLVVGELLVYVAVMSLLTIVPHAPLLSVTGALFPSSFSHSIVAQLSIMTWVASLTYGIVAGLVRSVDDALKVLAFGVEAFAPLFILYFFVCELAQSVAYVMMW